MDDDTQDKNFCLKKYSGGRITLNNSHAHYYQVQTQLFVANVDYCDFYICIKKFKFCFNTILSYIIELTWPVIKNFSPLKYVFTSFTQPHTN